MANDWIYSSEVDLTNAGADDLTAVTLISGLPSGLEEIEVFIIDASTDAENTAMILRIGDAGGIEATAYDSASTSGTTNSGLKTTHYSTSPDAHVDAATITNGCWRMYRLDMSQHIWIAEWRAMREGIGGNSIGLGFKELSEEITQFQITTVAGTAAFDGGVSRTRYR